MYNRWREITLDKYSYSQNSRIARRIKERERKRKRRRRIVKSVIAIAVVVCCGIGAVKFIPSFELPEFNPVEGFERLCIKLGIATESEEQIVSSDVPVIAGKVDEPSVENESETETASDAVTSSEEEIPVIDESDEPMESDFWNEESENIIDVASTKGIYPSPAENNNLLDIFKNAKGETEKICCLTFDDGPNKATTPQILDILAKHGIKATFFELGEKLAVNKELAKRTFDEGHLLANHTYTQKYSTIYVDKEVFIDEVSKTEKLIEEVTGEPAYKLLRFPGGGFNSGVYGGVKQEYKKVLADNGYYFIDWNVDNGDDGTRNASQILSYVKEYCGSKPIVLLMEDQNIRKATISSLDSVIEYLKSCGYTFKRLDEIAYYSAEEMPAAPIVNSNINSIIKQHFETRGRFI